MLPPPPPPSPHSPQSNVNFNTLLATPHFGRETVIIFLKATHCNIHFAQHLLLPESCSLSGLLIPEVMEPLLWEFYSTQKRTPFNPLTPTLVKTSYDCLVCLKNNIYLQCLSYVDLLLI